MKLDPYGYPDICRSTPFNLSNEAVDSMNGLKYAVNALINILRTEIDRNTDNEVRRLFALAATAAEECCLWGVKGFTAEGWIPPPPKESDNA